MVRDGVAGPPEATVFGLDNVPLELPIAGPGSRALAAFLDYLVVGIAVLVWAAVCFGVSIAAHSTSWWMFALFLIGAFVIEYGYFATVESLREGQTFGKWAVGLRVVTREAARPGTAAFLIRNAVRSVDLLAGIPMMAMDPLARRLGDRLAGTLVVHLQASPRDDVLHRTPQGWNAHETAVLEAFLWRAPEMEAFRAERLARQLLECIQRDDPALGSEIDHGLGPVDALARLVKPAKP